MKIEDPALPQNWIVLPPGDKAMLRYASPVMLPGTQLATLEQVLTANLGKPFPWGDSAEPKNAGPLWHNHMIGYGGLYHDKWFLTQQGRIGGADNVPKTLPGSLRHCLYLDGGMSPVDYPAENEGYALVKDVDPANRDMYRRVTLHSATHVMKDGGAIRVSEIFDDNKVMVLFAARCGVCPNPELISIKQLQASVPEYQFELFPEQRNWSLQRSTNPSLRHG